MFPAELRWEQETAMHFSRPVIYPSDRIPPELTGLEPATPAVTGRCSDQLSYNSRDISANYRGLVIIHAIAFRAIFFVTFLQLPVILAYTRLWLIHPMLPS